MARAWSATGSRDASVRSHLGVVAHASEQVIGNARGAAAAAGDLQGAGLFHLDIQETRGADDDALQLFGLVIVQPLTDGKPGQQRRGQQAAAGRCPDQRETGQVQADAAGIGPLIDDDIQLEILHGRIEVFLDGFLQAMDFIDEQARRLPPDW